MITISAHASDARLAARLMESLRADDAIRVTEGYRAGRGDALVAVLSPASVSDPAIMNGIYDTLDSGGQVIPVIAAPVAVPKVLDHLNALDFTTGEPMTALRERVAEALSPNAPLPVRARTPRVEQANRRVGIALAVLALVIAGIAIFTISNGIIGLPREEYAQVDTAVALTRDVMVGPTLNYLATFLPRGTEQANVFPATLEAAPTVVRPFVALTATAIHEQLAGFFPAAEATATATPAADG